MILYATMAAACIAILHPVMHVVLSYTFSSFAQHEQRLYIQKNLVKATVLAMMVPSIVPLGYKALLQDQWDWDAIRTIGLFYGMCDGYALVRYYDLLHPSTRFHHSIVSTFSIANWYVTQDPWRQLNVFAAVSVLTFPVNVYLALRYLLHETTKNRFIRFCWWVYTPAILFNAVYQGGVMWQSPSLLYGGILGALFFDDYFLWRHLHRQK